MNDEILPPNLDEALLAAQGVDQSLRAQYEQEVKAMFEVKMKPVQKSMFSIVGVLSAVMAVGFALAMFHALKTRMPWQVPVGFAAGTIFSVAWAVLVFRSLHRGRINLRLDEKMQAGLAWGFVVLMTTLFMLIAGRNPDSVRGVHMMVVGLIFLVAAAVGMVMAGINASRLKIEERLLETQLKIAELAEQIKNTSRRP